MAILNLPATSIPKQPPAYGILRKANFQSKSSVQMPCCSIKDKNGQGKMVWIWTESKQVMTAAVERGWNNFIFKSDPRFREIANEWSSIALINPLFVEGSELFNKEKGKVATFYDVCNPRDLEILQPNDSQTDTVIINFHGEWQVIPAENIVAAFQGSNKNVFAVSSGSSDAKLFFEALEHGLDGVVLKVEESGEILNLKEYFDRITEVRNVLSLTKATVTKIEAVGMGDRVCVDLCSLMKPGEGLLVGSFARGLFLVHSECLESNYIASRPFRVNAGPVHAYVAVPGGKTCYLAELKASKEVIVVDQSGFQRTAVVGRVKIESRPLILVEAKDIDNNNYSIFLQNAETVGLVCHREGDNASKTCTPVTSLKIGDEVVLRLQGGARHTGLEIQEFILEK